MSDLKPALPRQKANSSQIDTRLLSKKRTVRKLLKALNIKNGTVPKLVKTLDKKRTVRKLTKILMVRNGTVPKRTETLLSKKRTVRKLLKALNIKTEQCRNGTRR